MEEGFSQGTPFRMRKQRPRPEPGISREEETETQGQHHWLELPLPVRAGTQPRPWRKVEGQASPIRHSGGLSRAGQRAGSLEEEHQRSGSECPRRMVYPGNTGEAPIVCKFSRRHTLRRRTAWGSEGLGCVLPLSLGD